MNIRTRFLRARSRKREVADTGVVMGVLGKYATKERMAINLRQNKFAFLQFSAFQSLQKCKFCLSEVYIFAFRLVESLHSI